MAADSRFEAELEFVQRLANPEYLHCARKHAARHDQSGKQTSP
jgi:hypothetical protein